MNTFLGIFFLFQDEHDMVKELLQFLIGEVNTQLLEAIVLHIGNIYILYMAYQKIFNIRIMLCSYYYFFFGVCAESECAKSECT